MKDIKLKNHRGFIFTSRVRELLDFAYTPNTIYTRYDCTRASYNIILLNCFIIYTIKYPARTYFIVEVNKRLNIEIAFFFL